MPILKLSYDYLPSHLKCCFAYCSLFPKDYLIDKLTLIQLWISQGFIQSSEEGHELEHVANEYFMELLWRSFFQEAEEDGGENRRFKMHDLIHDLAQYVSEIDCTLVDSNAKNVKEKGHHLSFPFYNISFFEENLSKLVKANKIRTFMLAYKNRAYDQGRIEESTLEKLISSFRFLRALDLHSLNMKMLPDTIGTLMHLKYLDLSSNDIEVLPSSITKLVNLQTLKLCECEKLRELPVDIQKMVSLKHLDVSSNDIEVLPSSITKLVNLQTLKLCECEKLRELPVDIQKMVSLKHLDVSSNDIEVLPSSITKLVNLQTLKLCECEKLRELPVDIQKMVSLKHLDVSSNDIEVLPSSITKLVNLQTLKLCKCKKLRELPVDIQKLVSLKHLDLEDCKNLTHMPHGLGQLTSLQTLKLFVVGNGSSSGLVELNKLNDLRGNIEIINLAWVKDATSEFKVANLKEKEHLSGLRLFWNPEGDDGVDASDDENSVEGDDGVDASDDEFHSVEGDDASDDENSMEGDDGVDASDDENSMDSLQPHVHLKYLKVDGYMGVRVSSWLSFLTNLVDLYIDDCENCQYLPPLYQLPSLRELSLMNMDGLEYMTDGDMNDEISASLASPSTFFPSLQTLELIKCLNLKGWWRSVDKGNEATTTSTISSSSSTNHYHQHIPSFPGLSFLWLDNCPKMTCMPLFPNLEEKLILENSSLKALEETIEMNNRGGRASSFPSSSSSSSPSFSPPLSKLKELSLRKIQELESLPEEWFKNLTSLKTLHIWGCPNLTSLPEGISHLTSLRGLHIWGCPQLKQRCEEENGEDWDKISHIPHLDIR
ncbi:putative disease resistance protein RGA3 isoform X1 [Quercus lobata]|uniref:putative disease resistance protein RGA3 isoform X1 n=1 Tax=Quercus lobata TaxID=97700 RepID=UPI0012453F04|nr:putative disease resistance protein RGA3 isoform X1 [Quercus lobata]XP_030954117.1 putative disease resistance protein RGA3 isoform X1 [Quercus lobata]XP_030954126.1 putative disease resistance protein RGA3 isoform X1 [Quercus lobata]XP_030954130.1 putative disease resistance protein RGA3 isoform X1 [Quercus lobata]XP_030954137.1 putative disease resistance protein RGA3 isoform X1 [Quercus lobata]XP_030954141.1 putative disease resistance protein RGA3 isoform X1 [Quercus lobata]XP_03095414